MQYQQIFNLLIICAGTLFSGASYSVPSPIYPEEALARGVTVTQSGIVIGFAYLVTFVCTPLCGPLIERFGAYPVFLLGVLLNAAGNIAFGFLTYIEDGLVFFCLSLVFRCISALGEDFILPTAYSLGSQQVSETNKGRAVSLIESCFGIGLVVGPVIGGSLYNVGGFLLPFCTVGGGIGFIFSLAVIFFKSKPSAEEEDVQEIGYKEIFSSPGVLTFAMGVTFCSSASTWYSATMEPYLHNQFGLTSLETGWILMAFALSYTLLGPVFGLCIDKGLSSGTAVLAGNITVMLSMLLIGPVPGLWFLQSVPVLLVGLVVQGVGTASSLIGALMGMMEATKRADLPQTEKTTGMVGGIWLLGVSLGDFLGTLGGSFTYDRLGFAWSCTIEAILLGVSVILFVCLAVVLPRRAKLKQYEQLP